MALTVADDFTTIKDMDNNSGVTRVGEGDPFGGNPTADSNVQAQGSASCGRVPNNTGLGGFDFDTGAANVDVTDEHILMWAYPAAFTYSNLRIRISSNADAAGNYGEWNIVTPDDALAITEGAWIILAADVLKAFDGTAGTPPAITGVRSFACMVNITTVVAEASKFYVDEYKRGTGITVTGGAATPRGSTEVAANDKTNGRGTFIDAKGAFYVMGRITIGDVTAATNSTYEDEGETWIWQDLPVSATFHMLEFVGGTGTNRATFGTSSGAGDAKEGSGGNTFKSAGDIPFRVKAVDSDITAELFGCALTGPATLYDDAIRNFKQEDNSASSFTDDTRDANDPGANDVALFPAGAGANDAAYFGHDERISLLKVNTGTAGAGTYTVTWEYYNGTAWASLTDVTDGTGAFKTTGLQTVSYAIPADWAKVTVDTDNRYWIRARRDGGTVTTNPSMTQCFASMGGMVEWEHINAEAIRCTFTNMDTIRIRNNAKLKKCIITDSVAPAKSAALDLGGSDPATDTVRDLTIQGNPKGILLQGTGNVTYNQQNYAYSGNNAIDQAWQHDASPSAFVDETADCNSVTANDVQFFPASPAVNDAFYLGDEGPFDRARFNIGQAGAGTYTWTAQYWNGTAWTALSRVFDATNDFKTAGINWVRWQRPADWQRTSVNGVEMFYVRFLRDGGTETTRPLGTTVEIPGDVRVDWDPPIVVDSWSESNVDGDEELGGSVYPNGLGQSFTAAAGKLTRVRLYLKKTGTPSGSAVVKLYPHSGTYGTSSVPTGAALATSEPFEVSFLTTSYQLIDFDFTDEFALVASTQYVWAIEYANGDLSNFVSVGTGLGGGHGGNLSRLNGSWVAASGPDLAFYVYRDNFVEINVLEGGDVPLIDNVNESVVKVRASKTLTLGIPGFLILSDSEVRIFDAGTTNERTGVESSGTTFQYQYEFQASDFVDIRIIKEDRKPVDFKNFELPNADSSIPIQQQLDRGFLNPPP